MPVRGQYRDFVLEQLEGLGTLRCNRMFGCVGIYGNEVFFALIDDDTLYFKTDAGNDGEYIERGMPRFAPFPDRPASELPYRQVPAEVIEDAETLVQWARRSVAAALNRKASKRRPAKKSARKKSTRR